MHSAISCPSAKLTIGRIAVKVINQVLRLTQEWYGKVNPVRGNGSRRQIFYTQRPQHQQTRQGVRRATREADDSGTPPKCAFGQGGLESQEQGKRCQAGG